MNLINTFMNANISSEDVAVIYEMTKKREAVAKLVDLSKVKEREDNKQFYVYIKRKQYTGRDFDDLINNIYNEFFKVDSLESLYKDMMIYKRDVDCASDKTLKEYMFRWNKLKKLEIVKKPLKNLKAIDYITAFKRFLAENTMTKTAFRDYKSVLNAIYYVAIERGIVEINPLETINYNQFKYKANNLEKQVLTVEQRKILLDYLNTVEEDMYTLAIQFDLCVLARIAEIKSLKVSDISNNYIRIQRQITDQQSMNDDLSFNVTEHIETEHIKGNTEQGYRNMPLIPLAKEILFKARKLNPSGEYIFMYENRPLTTVTFNRRLKKYCKACGIQLDSVSSHDLRFSVASALYKENVSPTELQKLLGHTTLQMTLHYLRLNTTIEETASKMCAIL